MATYNTSTWPPQSKRNWVEVMVVADGPMVEYHGDNLKQYILTLLNIVRLHLFFISQQEI
jgi:hypothetical protein